ncbi:MAG: hypothetical protein ACD_3C00232G0004 [uncultured bacterium (gcode 4)]|uniref:Uncharacterized protein n=1 Tax=uncultured bacterium (gcode 4) TaxID=1234023 RepID=K2FWA0_9BACT|nr:MAG: hypothetical protein ACD_3C00232G0004 [uncultured bacterium (gcode 4)]
MATTSRIWMNPLIVYDDTIPSSQSTIRITAIVSNIKLRLWFRNTYYTQTQINVKKWHQNNVQLRKLAYNKF